MEPTPTPPPPEDTKLKRERKPRDRDAERDKKKQKMEARVQEAKEEARREALSEVRVVTSVDEEPRMREEEYMCCSVMHPKKLEVSPPGTMYAAPNDPPSLQQLFVPLACGVGATYLYKKYPPFTSIIDSFLEVLATTSPQQQPASVTPAVQCSEACTQQPVAL